MPTHFRALALDYDGTLTTTPRPEQAALDALRELRSANFRIVLVTGRILRELTADFADVYEYFDAIVAENGAVFWQQGEERLLVPAVSAALEANLASQGVPVRRGSAILALDAAYDDAVRRACVSLGLDHQLIHNRSAMMVLPAGTSKGTGLRDALFRLGISRHSTIGIGDAENDLALLEASEIGVAVANAVPSLKEHADVVLDIPGGAELASFLRPETIERLGSVQPKRHRLRLGYTDDGTEVNIPAAGIHVFIDGPTGAGKSYVTGLMLEQLAEQGYMFCVLDMEGDHTSLEAMRGVLALGGRKPLPSVEDVADLVRHRVGSLVLDLSLRDVGVRDSYARDVLQRLTELRRDTALPHWIVIEEAHVMTRQALEEARAAGSLCLVTYHPDWLGPSAIAACDMRITVENSGRACIRPLGRQAVSTSFQMAARSVPHVRHRRKYADSEVPYERGFTFRDASGSINKHVTSLSDFCAELRHVPRGVLAHHAGHFDFSRWVREVFQDRPLAASLRQAETDFQASGPEAFREEVRKLIELRAGKADSDAS